MARKPSGPSRGRPGAGPLEGRTIVVGVCGSIAAYKACELVSRLVQLGARVPVVMTASAARFVQPFTFQALTRIRVLLDPFDPETIVDASHVRLTDDADAVVVAPATANTIAKIAHGMGDDALTSVLLTVRCPVLVAPAMNVRMWESPVVRKNVAALRELGHRIVEPGEGYLACGTYATGRLAEPAAIVDEVRKVLGA